MIDIKEQLHNLNKNSNSLSLLREINKSIQERQFHEHTHILYDLRTFLGKSKKKYVEIGSYVGSSASLILKHSFDTDVICIEPCVLGKSHYHGTDTQYKTLSKNLENNNPHKRNFKIFKNFSYDQLPIDEIKNIDILHIDGDHSYNAVIQDYNLYKDKLNSGGFVIFDDYHDKQHSPEVKSAVDFIVSQINKSEYDIIGCLDNYHKISEERHPKTHANFILYKK